MQRSGYQRAATGTGSQACMHGLAPRWQLAGWAASASASPPGYCAAAGGPAACCRCWLAQRQGSPRGMDPGGSSTAHLIRCYGQEHLHQGTRNSRTEVSTLWLTPGRSTWSWPGPARQPQSPAGPRTPAGAQRRGQPAAAEAEPSRTPWWLPAGRSPACVRACVCVGVGVCVRACGVQVGIW